MVEFTLKMTTPHMMVSDAVEDCKALAEAV
jgi:hypothetical protein